MKFVLATRNQGKIREFQKRFSEIGWEVIPIADIADIPEPEETGTTFRENALQKARYYAEAVNLPVLSDDSGIIADVLGNEPGVYSARYAGVHGNDEANNQKLVEVLRPYRGEARRGHYMCVIAVVWPNGREITAIFIKEQADLDMIRCFICRNLERQWRSYPWRKRIK